MAGGGPRAAVVATTSRPGAAEDGVTVDVPLTTLNQVDDTALSWQVPGLREDLVVALLRSLPKQLRVSFVPAPNYARDFLAATSPGEESLLDALERWLRARTGVVVPRDAWDWTKVPAHLRPTYRVVADDGSVVSTGKDLARLKEPLAGSFAAALEPGRDGVRRDRPRPRGRSGRSSAPSSSTAPATGSGGSPRSSTRAAPSGSGSSAPRSSSRPRTGGGCAGCSR